MTIPKRTKRQAKTGGKAVDQTCGNNKRCPTCRSNYLHSRRRVERIAVEKQEEAHYDSESV